jgi:hypothetical protein
LRRAKLLDTSRPHCLVGTRFIRSGSYEGKTIDHWQGLAFLMIRREENHLRLSPAFLYVKSEVHFWL